MYIIIHGHSKGEPDGCVFPSLGFSNKRKKESGAIFGSDETDRPLEVIKSVYLRKARIYNKECKCSVMSDYVCNGHNL